MIKGLLWLCFLATASVFAQATFTIEATAANEQNLSVTLSATAVTNEILAIETVLAGNPFPGVGMGAGWPNSLGAIPSNTTLAAAVTTTAQTSITLTSGVNVQPCNGILIGTELMLVTARTGNVATVVRSTIGTTASTYANGTAVTITRAGGGTCMLKSILADAVDAQIQQILQGAAVTTQTTAIATSNASIASTVAAAVQ